MTIYFKSEWDADKKLNFQHFRIPKEYLSLGDRFMYRHLFYEHLHIFTLEHAIQLFPETYLLFAYFYSISTQ